MKLFIKNAFFTILFNTGVLKIYSLKKKKDKAFIITYHRIISPSFKRSIYFQPGMYVLTDTFEKHVKLLKQNFNVIPLAELIEQFDNKKSIGGCCSITFDDGWQDNFKNAFPILKKLQIPATIFLVSNYIGSKRIFWPEEVLFYLWQHGDEWIQRKLKDVDPFIKETTKKTKKNVLIEQVIMAMKRIPSNKRENILEHLRSTSVKRPSFQQLLNWDEAKIMMSSGLISFGAHSANHAILDQIPLNEAENEIILSLKELEMRLGSFPKYFAYPNGNYTPKIQRILKNSGVKGAVTTKKGWVVKGTALFEIPRIGMHEDVSRTIPLFWGRILFDNI